VVLYYPFVLTGTEVILITEGQQDKDYEIEITSLHDAAGNGVDPNYNSYVFVGTALPDTFRPGIVSTVPEDSANTVLADKPLVFHFDEAMQSASLQSSFNLIDSSGSSVTGQFSWLNPAVASFSPDNHLLNSVFYTITIELDSVFDSAGN